MPWDRIEAVLVPLLAHKYRAGRSIPGMGLFGSTLAVASAVVSPAGRQRRMIRLMGALLYLKRAYNLSDEALVEHWAQDVHFQFINGMNYYESTLPFDANQLGRFRCAIGEAGIEELLTATIDISVLRSLSANLGSKMRIHRHVRPINEISRQLTTERSSAARHQSRNASQAYLWDPQCRQRHAHFCLHLSKTSRHLHSLPNRLGVVFQI
jgi:hypothetical protein